MKTKDLNRLKVVLVEQKKTAKWLASELMSLKKIHLLSANGVLILPSLHWKLLVK